MDIIFLFVHEHSPKKCTNNKKINTEKYTHRSRLSPAKLIEKDGTGRVRSSNNAIPIQFTYYSKNIKTQAGSPILPLTKTLKKY